MARRCFYSFHYDGDHWRASKIRNIGVIEGSQTVSDNDWETVTKGGDPAIEKWIADQMKGRSCAIVLIGKDTANRKWINYEIAKAWNDGKGVFGIYIHNITDANGKQTSKGKNPFSYLDGGKTKLSPILKTYDPPKTVSADVYKYISDNVEGWVDAAIKIRNDN